MIRCLLPTEEYLKQQNIENFSVHNNDHHRSMVFEDHIYQEKEFKRDSSFVQKSSPLLVGLD